MLIYSVLYFFLSWLLVLLRMKRKLFAVASTVFAVVKPSNPKHQTTKTKHTTEQLETPIVDSSKF